MLFISILQFLTTITISKNAYYDGDIGDGIVYFPVVGIILGAIEALVSYILLYMGVSAGITSIIVVGTGVVLTGGLHLDGLSDTFDGIFSYRSKERILEIMKDSRLGTNGMISLLFLILLKLQFTREALEAGKYFYIFIMPMVARFVAVILTYKSVSARKNGMGEFFIGKGRIDHIIVDFAIVGAVSILTVGVLNGVIVLIGAFLFSYLFRRFIYSRIDGLTGDTLGCAIEMYEAISLMICLVCMNLR